MRGVCARSRSTTFTLCITRHVPLPTEVSFLKRTISVCTRRVGYPFVEHKFVGTQIIGPQPSTRGCGSQLERVEYGTADIDGLELEISYSRRIDLLA